MLLELFDETFIRYLERVIILLENKFRAKLKAQGHEATGNLSRSFKHDIGMEGMDIVVNMYMEKYGIVIDQGIKANRIPYGKKNTGAKTSKYIEGLIRHWINRGLSQLESKSAAFATANKQSREGMPTRASFLYSNDGTRTGFVNSVMLDQMPELNRLFDKAVNDSFEVIFTDLIGKYQVEFNRS